MAMSLRKLSLLAMVLVMLISLETIFKLTKGNISCLIPAEGSKTNKVVNESELTILFKADRWKEVNATTSSLTKRSFLYHSNNTVIKNENDAVSVWNFERLQVVVMANNSFAPTNSSSKWTETDVWRWCPQPVLSVLESPKLVKAKDYKDRTIYPESYVTKNYSAVAEQYRLFKIPSVKNNSYTLTIADLEKIVKAAVCQIHQDWHKMAVHFPHAMQEIYTCIDYWIANMGGDDGAFANPIIPVFLYNNTSQEEMMERWKTNEFMKGILGTLQEEMGVVIMTSKDYMTCAIFDSNENNHSIPEIAKQMEVCKKVFHPEQTIRTSMTIVHGYTFEKATEFNVYVKSFLRKQNHTYEQEPLYHPGQWKTDTNSSRVCARPPKIGILNRQSSRGIINANQLAEDLSGLMYVYRNSDDDVATKDSIKGYPVEVIFFEGLSFAEQVDFFWRTDIVISGHGAQLTGLPFLNVDNSLGQCRQVMELYPHEYAIPVFFGSLVVGTGMSHSYVYFDDALRPERSGDPVTSPQLDRPPLRVRPLLTVTPWMDVVGDNYKDRSLIRRSQFCPRRDDMVDYVSELIFDWYRCHGC